MDGKKKIDKDEGLECDGFSYVIKFVYLTGHKHAGHAFCPVILTEF